MYIYSKECLKSRKVWLYFTFSCASSGAFAHLHRMRASLTGENEKSHLDNSLVAHHTCTNRMTYASIRVTCKWVYICVYPYLTVHANTEVAFTISSLCIPELLNRYVCIYIYLFIRLYRNEINVSFSGHVEWMAEIFGNFFAQ